MKLADTLTALHDRLEMPQDPAGRREAAALFYGVLTAAAALGALAVVALPRL